MVVIRNPRGGGAAGVSVYEISGGMTNGSSSLSDLFQEAGATSTQGLAAESAVSRRTYNQFTITDIEARVALNAKAVESEVVFRDDGVDIAATRIAITASTTGLFEVTGISEIVADDSIINYRLRGNAAGSIRVSIMTVRVTA